MDSFDWILDESCIECVVGCNFFAHHGAVLNLQHAIADEVCLLAYFEHNLALLLNLQWLHVLVLAVKVVVVVLDASQLEIWFA